MNFTICAQVFIPHCSGTKSEFSSSLFWQASSSRRRVLGLVTWRHVVNLTLRLFPAERWKFLYRWERGDRRVSDGMGRMGVNEKGTKGKDPQGESGGAPFEDPTLEGPE